MQLAPRQGLLEGVAQGQRAGRVRLHLGREEAVGVAPVFLDAVHGGFGVFEQGVELLAVVGGDGDANGCGHKNLLARHLQGLGQCIQQAGAELGGFVLAGVGQQGDKVITGMARERVVVLQVGAQAVGDFEQQQVALAVAQRVVDVFETVNVDPEQGQGGALAESVLEVRAQQGAVGQAGELVVVRELLYALGHVFFVGKVAGDLALGVAQGVNEHRFGVFAAAFAAVAQLAMPRFALGELGPHAAVDGRGRFARLQDARVLPQHFGGGVFAGAGEGVVDVFDAALQVGDDDGQGVLRNRLRELAHGLFALQALGDVARDDHVTRALARLRGLARHRQLKPALAVGHLQGNHAAAREACLAGFVQGGQRDARGFGGQGFLQGFTEQRDGGCDQGACVAGACVYVAPVVVEFEQRVGQGIQRGLQLPLRVAQQGVRPLHGFHKNRAVQKGVGQHFVKVAREVVDVGDAGVAGKEKLALRHDARRRKQAAGVEAALAAHVPQQPGCGGKVQRHQRVFESDLEGGQPAARHKGDGQQVRRQKEQPVQRRHQHQHRSGHQGGLRARGGAAPGQPGHRQQGQCAQQPRRQPVVDGFFGRVGGNEIGHAAVRQHVAEVEQAHAQESAAQQQGIERQLLAPHAPCHAKGERRHHNRQRFQRHVQGQIVRNALQAWKHGQRHDQQQQHKQRDHGTDGLAGCRLVAWVDQHGRGWCRLPGVPRGAAKQVCVQV